jgi:DNA-directed RNA polymerase-3 subunit RPC5
MPPRRRKTAKDAEESAAEQERGRIEIADDSDDNEVLSSEDDDGDDPVLQTYDVFISDQLKDHIYLLQYPIRNPQEQYYDESVPFEARIKPTEGVLEIDVPFDPNNLSFIRGEKFAGHSTEPGVKREARVLDRQRLSGMTQPSEANYFVAMTRRGTRSSQSTANLQDQMHLSPVKATVQLRPSFHYFDALVGGEKRKKAPSDESAVRQPRAVQVLALVF